METKREPTFRPSVYLGTMWKHRWLVLAFMALVITGAVVFTKRQPRVFEASTQILIERSAPQYLPGQIGREVVSLGVGNYWSATEYLETQYRILRSRMVAGLVVTKLGLDKDLDFLGLSEIEDPQARAEKLAHIDAVAVLEKKVKIDPVQDSYVVFVKVRDRKPERAALIADTIATCYEEANLGRKTSGAIAAVVWLEIQSAELRTELEGAEDALLRFKRDHNILSASLADKQNLVTRKLQDAERQMREARAERYRFEAALDQIRKLSGVEAETSVEAVLENGLIQRLKEQIVALQNERTDLLTRYLEQHPGVLAVDRKILRVRKALEREVAGIRESLSKQFKAAMQTENRLAAELVEIEGTARELMSEELSYRRLLATTETKKQLHTEILLRLKEAELQAQSGANNVRILDHAMVPSIPVSPKPVLNVAVAAVLALVFGLGLAFLVENLDTTIKSQEQLEQEFGLTFLGLIPSVRAQKEKRFEASSMPNTDRYVIDFPNSTVAECVRTVRTNLLFMAPEKELKTLCVTSAGPREGKTSTCINVGATMAIAGSRVLIVDSDLRRPRTHKIFDMTNDFGLTNMVMDAAVEVEDMVQHTDVDGLDILTSGPIPPNPAELLHSGAFARVVERLVSKYDRVIFDSPPVVAVTDAQILGNMCDGTLIVVRAGATGRDMLAKATRLLRDVNVNLLGALLNNFDVTRRGYGTHYYHYYQYYRQYGTYYSDDAQPARTRS